MRILHVHIQIYAIITTVSNEERACHKGKLLAIIFLVWPMIDELKMLLEKLEPSPAAPHYQSVKQVPLITELDRVMIISSNNHGVQAIPTSVCAQHESCTPRKPIKLRNQIAPNKYYHILYTQVQSIVQLFQLYQDHLSKYYLRTLIARLQSQSSFKNETQPMK